MRALALDVYVHRLRKYIGAYVAVLGGLDALSFTAGVGENDAVVRAETAAGLEFLGIEIDPVRNAVRSERSAVDLARCREGRRDGDPDRRRDGDRARDDVAPRRCRLTTVRNDGRWSSSSAEL